MHALANTNLDTKDFGEIKSGVGEVFGSDCLNICYFRNLTKLAMVIVAVTFTINTTT